MMRARVALLMILAAGVASTLLAATPAHRPDPGTVVQTLPDEGRALSVASRRMAPATADQALAMAAELYARGQRQRDVREFGRAEQILQSWLGAAPVMVLQARLLQRRHRFADAVEAAGRSDRARAKTGRTPACCARVCI